MIALQLGPIRAGSSLVCALSIITSLEGLSSKRGGEGARVGCLDLLVVVLLLGGIGVLSQLLIESSEAFGSSSLF